MRLHVHEWGPRSAPPLLAIHGITGSGPTYGRLAARLGERYHLVAPDLRGHGRSGKEPPWNIATLVADLAETCDGLGLDRAAVLGFSLGGRLAVELAARHPARAERLVLLDPALQIPPGIALARADEIRTDRTWASPEEAIAENVATGLAPYAPPEHWIDWADRLEAGADGRVRWRASRSAAAAIFGELASPPPSYALCRVPTLLITGSESPLVTEAQLAAYRDGLGELLTVRSVRAKHQVMGDALDDVYGAVAAFLAR